MCSWEMGRRFSISAAITPTPTSHPPYHRPIQPSPPSYSPSKPHSTDPNFHPSAHSLTLPLSHIPAPHHPPLPICPATIQTTHPCAHSLTTNHHPNICPSYNVLLPSSLFITHPPTHPSLHPPPVHPSTHLPILVCSVSCMQDPVLALRLQKQLGW